MRARSAQIMRVHVINWINFRSKKWSEGKNKHIICNKNPLSIFLWSNINSNYRRPTNFTPSLSKQEEKYSFVKCRSNWFEIRHIFQVTKRVASQRRTMLISAKINGCKDMYCKKAIVMYNFVGWVLSGRSTYDTSHEG